MFDRYFRHILCRRQSCKTSYSTFHIILQPLQFCAALRYGLSQVNFKNAKHATALLKKLINGAVVVGVLEGAGGARVGTGNSHFNFS